MLKVGETVSRSGGSPERPDVNRDAFLCCRRCGGTFPLDAPSSRCPTCDGHPGGIVEVDYDYAAIARWLGRSFWERRDRTLWQYAPLLPVGGDGRGITLGEGNSPLIGSRRIGPAWGMPRLFFKNDTGNPTWSHKDRFHAVSTTMAAALGFRSVVASSTGNHGASTAAYATAAGLASLILCPPQTSPLLLSLIQAFGGQVVVTEWDARDRMGRHLVDKRGWFPATGLDATFAFSPNPFGVEGHKTIAYEIVRDLGRAPDGVFVPCAGGDTFYGIWKGFRELGALGVIDRLPRMYGCQPSGANALEQTLARGDGVPVVLDHPHSIATSTRERTIGAVAAEVVRESGGDAPTASDDDILEAVGALGREGLCVEPSSALPVACVGRLVAAGRLDREETAVCLLTAAGIKWPEVLARTVEPPTEVEPTIASLERHLAAIGGG